MKTLLKLCGGILGAMLLASEPNIYAQNATTTPAKGLHFAPDTDDSRATVIAFLKNPPPEVLAYYPQLEHLSTFQVKGPIHLYAALLRDFTNGGGMATAQDRGGALHRNFAGSEDGKNDNFCVYEVSSHSSYIAMLSFDSSVLKKTKNGNGHLAVGTISISNSNALPNGTIVDHFPEGSIIYVDKSGEAIGKISGVGPAMGAPNTGVGESIISVSKSGEIIRKTVWLPRPIDVAKVTWQRDLVRAIDQAAAIAEVRAGSYEARLLGMHIIGDEGGYLHAVWLKADAGDNDLIYIYRQDAAANNWGKIAELKLGLYTSEEFLKIILPLAQKDQAAFDALKGKPLIHP